MDVIPNHFSNYLLRWRVLVCLKVHTLLNNEQLGTLIAVNHKNTPLGYHCSLLSFATGCHGIVLLTPTASLAQNEEKMRRESSMSMLHRQCYIFLGISLILLIYIFNVRKIVVSVYD